MDNRTNISIMLAPVSIKNITSLSKELVLHPHLSNTSKMTYNRYPANSTVFPRQIRSQLIGHLLGDG